MGCAGSKGGKNPEEPAKATDTPLRPRRKQSCERNSVVGNMVQQNMSERSFSDDYDDNGHVVLGSGMSGSVFTAVSRRTHVRHAIKTLNIQQMGVEGMEELRREVSAMRRLDHPNIVRLFETYEDHKRGQIIMVLELCSGGELVNKLMEQPQNRGLSERDAAGLVTKMLSALLHCHQHDVVHRDIKLDNFVYESTAQDAELKLIDFGLSHVAARGRGEVETMTGRVGTLSYMAPEVLLRHPYTAACDMWSLGVVAFILLSGRRPFHCRDRQEKIQRILTTEPSFGTSWATTSAQAIDFVRRLLVKEPELRMTAQEAMRHEWILKSKADSVGKELRNPMAAIAHNSHVLRSMQAFSGASMMHKVALELLAFATPSAEVDDMRRVFYAIDTDGSGTISRDEFDAAMGAHPELNSQALKSLFDTLDFAKKGELGYNEFLAATLGGSQKLQNLDEETVRNVFQMIDRDSDGIVTRDDLMQCLGANTTEEELDVMFAQLGKKADGKLFFMDLYRLMSGKDGTKHAGITLKRSVTLSPQPEGEVKSRGPSFSQVGRSSTMSNVVLHTEASAHNAEDLSQAARAGIAVMRTRSSQDNILSSASAQDPADGATSGSTAAAAVPACKGRMSPARI
ncbi:calcium-dependent protein [Chrysochromulina tobinii]|uniref:Calcium-dependent protein n=1 Tax=Chrysochromulina tobinii TaxID=1460289 RepID=A0A0M0K1P8_9EUKA|nr:calcium-dependent protein [Chrysochromulina tobinii]|eukprot:KOO32313.1 calcium-dependent protein [Chrysochromulina sp. CCMP291]